MATSIFRLENLDLDPVENTPDRAEVVGIFNRNNAGKLPVIRDITVVIENKIDPMIKSSDIDILRDFSVMLLKKGRDSSTRMTAMMEANNPIRIDSA